MAPNMESTFASSGYTYQWMIDNLKENDKTFADRLQKADVKEVSYTPLGKDGVTSIVYKVNIAFEDGESDHSVALKIIDTTKIATLTSDPKNAENFVQTARLTHEREVQFYKDFNNQNLPFLPKIYAIETRTGNGKEGAVLMENLCNHSSLQNMFRQFNVRQVLSTVKTLVRLAAESLTKGNLVKQYPFPQETVTHMFIATVEKTKIIESTRPDLREPLRRIRKLLETPAFLEYAFTKVNDDLGIPPVLAHSDIHANNIMWEKNGNGTCNDRLYALIDWQLVHSGHIGHDLGGLMAMSVDTDIRREAEEWICDYFHALLKCELSSRNMQMPYSVDQIKRAYRIGFVRQMLFFLQAITVVTERMKAEEGKEEVQKERFWRLLKCSIEDSAKILESDFPQFAC